MEEDYTIPLHRRGYQRFQLQAQATLIAESQLERPSILKDLSARGAGVVSNEPLNLNEKVEIVIFVPYFFDAAVHRKAKVVWCNRIDEQLWQAGLDFGLDIKIDL